MTIARARMSRKASVTQERPVEWIDEPGDACVSVAKPGPVSDLTLVSISLPLKTVNPLNGSHGHWAKLAARRKAERMTVALVVRPQVHGMALPVTITLTRIAPSSGLDFDGLTASQKSVRDGVTDGLGLKDDNDPRLTWQYRQERSQEYGVRIEICRR